MTPELNKNLDMEKKKLEKTKDTLAKTEEELKDLKKVKGSSTLVSVIRKNSVIPQYRKLNAFKFTERTTI